MAIKAGDFITITKRKCSVKVQPYLKEGGIYCVQSVDELKDGTKVLVLFRDLDKLTRCNAKRFDWKRYEKTSIAKQMTDFRMDLFEQKVNSKCTDDENATISFRPIMIVVMMWRYGDLVLDYCSKNKLSKFQKTSRALRGVRADIFSYLDKNLGFGEVRKIQGHVDEFIKENKFDFSALQYSVKNVLLIRDYQLEHLELYTNVIIGILMCGELYSYEMKAEKILSDKKIYHTKEYHLPYRKEFFLCLSSFIEGVAYEISSEVKRCMETFERNIDSIKFVKEN